MILNFLITQSSERITFSVVDGNKKMSLQRVTLIQTRDHTSCIVNRQTTVGNSKFLVVISNHLLHINRLRDATAAVNTLSLTYLRCVALYN